MQGSLRRAPKQPDLARRGSTLPFDQFQAVFGTEDNTPFWLDARYFKGHDDFVPSSITTETERFLLVMLLLCCAMRCWVGLCCTVLCCAMRCWVGLCCTVHAGLCPKTNGCLCCYVNTIIAAGTACSFDRAAGTTCSLEKAAASHAASCDILETLQICPAALFSWLLDICMTHKLPVQPSASRGCVCLMLHLQLYSVCVRCCDIMLCRPVIWDGLCQLPLHAHYKHERTK